jgi:maltose/moltooligosaccharide transporter
MQSLFIGLGAVIASVLPWFLNQLGYGGVAIPGKIPPSVRLSFFLGSAVFLGAVLWTVFTTKEYPHDHEPAKVPVTSVFGDILESFVHMPGVMKQLAPVQLATWLGLFCMWLYFPVAIARRVFGAVDQNSATYAEGVAWGGVCFAMYSAVCFAFSFVLPGMARRFGERRTHVICLGIGALGLISVAFIHDKYLLLFSMTCVGIAWASTLSMPYAMLSDVLPREKIGVYMGIFNFFIVLPEIIASLFFGWVMQNLLNNNRLTAVVLGGVFMAVASLLLNFQHEPKKIVAAVQPA